MSKETGITKWFGENLAQLLAQKIKKVYPAFDGDRYFNTIKNECLDLSYTQRVELHADVLKENLPMPYPKAISILLEILGDENPNETGMFTNFYCLMPIGKFVQKSVANNITDYLKVNKNATVKFINRFKRFKKKYSVDIKTRHQKNKSLSY